MIDKPIQRILLCGFMGCGKTSVGQALAFRMKWKLLDTDALIERKEGCTIPEIFSKKGEPYFRQAETGIAKHLAKQKNVVISTGGGFLTKEENLRCLMEHDNRTAIVYLHCDFETCYHRIQGSTRPLVSSNTKAQLEELFQKRTQQYQAVSSFTISNDALVSDAVEEILGSVVIL